MTIYDLNATLSSNEQISLSEYKGKVMLIVNTASKCGFTPQFDDLEKIYLKYKDEGLEILGFPSNQFKQELKSDDDVLEFCKVNYGVTFPIFKISDVNGENENEVFKYLKSQKGFEGFDKHKLAIAMKAFIKLQHPDYKSTPDIKWNFTKFLVDREGNVVARFEPTKDMNLIEEEIKKLL